MSIENSTDPNAAEGDDETPEAPHGHDNPARPDDDNEVEGHGRQNPEMSVDQDDDTEGNDILVGG
jgi:hypothetical protein